MDEEHWCWSQCCDQGPHGCICGNDCGGGAAIWNYEGWEADACTLALADGTPIEDWRFLLTDEAPRNFLGTWKGSGVVVQEDDGYYYGEEN